MLPAAPAAGPSRKTIRVPVDGWMPRSTGSPVVFGGLEGQLFLGSLGDS